MVLAEGKSPKKKDQYFGYSETNKLVNFKAPKEMIGKIVDVKVDEAKQFSLNGTFLGVSEKAVVTQ